jgi:hypothetical protein
MKSGQHEYAASNGAHRGGVFRITPLHEYETKSALGEAIFIFAGETSSEHVPNVVFIHFTVLPQCLWRSYRVPGGQQTQRVVSQARG